MSANELVKRYSLDLHEENGLYAECHYPAEGPGRPASGCIYYAVRPGERTQFHRIDCDEYWIFNAGSTLELWIIGLDGKLTIRYCGIEEGADPTVRFAAGELFASRLKSGAADSTFLTCVTVPRFTQEGCEVYDKETMVRMYPGTARFWEAY